MAATLADSLEVVLPEVPAALVPQSFHDDLRALARKLPPVPRCGFEVRLGASPEVDFQQNIVHRDSEPGTLLAHVSRSAGNGLAWGRLEGFLTGWTDASSVLHAGIKDLWLELDRRPATSLSVFVGLPRAPTPAADSMILVGEALDRLASPAVWSRWRATLERCLDACRDGTYISHIGLMLGRATPGLRLNVKRLEPDDVGDYLQRVGWPGDADEPLELFRRLHPHVDLVAPCLDVAEHVGERIGFECHLERQPPAESRWEALLDELVGSGWCTSEKRDALLAWPGRVVPGHGTPTWPPELVRASLRQPADHFTSFVRQLSHVKVVYEPGRAVEAKGYFGFLHSWLRPASDPGARVRNGTRPRRGKGVTGAVAAATEFLLASRTSAGWWRDFSGTSGATEDWSDAFGWSDELVTAFVGAALARMPDARAQGASHRAWDLLVERRLPVGGWGYNAQAPVDASSTAWGLRLAAATGFRDSPPARKAHRVLEQHGLSDGGVATYREADCPRFRVASLTPPDGSYGGWCRTSHPCVTAAAAAVGGEPRREFLRRAQHDDGSWDAYWWRGGEYTTALAAEALSSTGRADDRHRVKAAVHWAIARLEPEGAVAGSPFATAWCIRVLRLAEPGTAASAQLGRSVAWLLDRQEPDGGWPASARLLAPRPDATDRTAGDTPPAASLDECRTYTTSTVLSALAGSLA
jgi:hypothetical protein